MARKENSVQAAIQGALQVFCQERSLQLFPPYANQQGGGLRKYCADIVGLLEDGDLILLEVKQLDSASQELLAFDENQHQVLVRMENIGVPVAYAYNREKALSYERMPQPAGWAVSTLDAVNRVEPSKLPNRRPSVKSHQTLLEWLRKSHSGGAVELFGMVHGAISSALEMRNGILVLLYSKTRRELASLSIDEVIEVVDVLQKNASLSTRHQSFLQKVLGASADVFSQFSAPPTSSKAGAQNPRRSRRP